MPFENIQNLLKNKDITFQEFSNALKKSGADEQTIKMSESIFTSLDKNKDGSINLEEWTSSEISNIDTNKNGALEENELNVAKDGNVFKTAGVKGSNAFISSLSAAGSENSDADNISGSGGGANSFRD